MKNDEKNGMFQDLIVNKIRGNNSQGLQSDFAKVGKNIGQKKEIAGADLHKKRFEREKKIRRKEYII